LALEQKRLATPGLESIFLRRFDELSEGLIFENKNTDKYQASVLTTFWNRFIACFQTTPLKADLKPIEDKMYEKNS
jgi:hypothetical protein